MIRYVIKSSSGYYDKNRNWSKNIEDSKFYHSEKIAIRPHECYEVLGNPSTGFKVKYLGYMIPGYKCLKVKVSVEVL